MHLPSDFKGRFFERMIGLASTGFSEDDTHVSLFVANPTLKKGPFTTSILLSKGAVEPVSPLLAFFL